MAHSIKLSYLRVKAFRSFAKEQFIEALPDNGLFGIIGKNLNTNGSSGSGKTNFHLAISYALGYCPFPATELQSWLTDEKMQVELGLATHLGPVVVKRGEDTSITIDGARFEGARVTNAKLTELFSQPIELVEALTFRQQKTPGRFLSMTDSQKKEFLSSLLNLSDIEKQIDAANSHANAYFKKVTEFNVKIDTLNKFDIATLAHQQTIETTEAQISEITKKLSETGLYKKSLEEEIKDLEKESEAVASKPDDDAISELKALIKECEDNDGKFINLHKDRLIVIDTQLRKVAIGDTPARIEADIEELKKSIEYAKKATCPRCEQPWTSPREALYEEALWKKMAELESSREKLTQINRLKAERTDSQSFLINFKNNKTELLKNLLKEAYSKKELNLKEMRKEINSRLKQLREVSYNYYETIDEYERDLIDCNHTISLNREAIERKTKIINELNNNKELLATILMKFNEESDFASSLKGFLGAIFNEVLQEISDEANETLKQLPNVAATTIQFDTEVANDKGIVRQEIKPVIIKNGVTVPIKSGLSGGQFTSIELATDLAISKIVSRRTGLQLNYLILDESFDGHDTPVKEACIELLKLAAKDKLIFVIDHATEINEHFDKYITIESQNDCSVIKSLA